MNRIQFVVYINGEMMESITFDEAAVLVAARDGDRAAFSTLVQQYQRRAYAAAYSFAGNREDAQELSQEAFVKAYKAMERFDTHMPFYPWLYRIIKNTCLNHLKKKKRHGEISLDAMMDSGYDVKDGERTPDGYAELDDLKRALRSAMTRLTPEQQEILRLRHFLEMSYSEIAASLEIPQGTVMSRLHGARKSLRRLMETKHEELVNS
jgi:RNA polymerase sigma-70 factor (ECF subfamily)